MTEYIFRDDVIESDLHLWFSEVFPLILVDQLDSIVYANDLFCDLIQYEKNELIGSSIKKIEGRATLRESVTDEAKHSMINRNYIVHEVEYIDGLGEPLLGYTYSSKLYKNVLSNKCKLVVFSPNKQRSKELGTNSLFTLDYLRTLEMAVNESNAVVVTNNNGEIIYVNKRYSELSQYDPSELIGKTPAIVNSGYQSKAFYQHMWETILSGGIWQGELKNRKKDGSLYWVRSTTVPINNASGRPKRFIAIQTDITDRITAEHSLQRALKNEFNETVKNLYNIVFKYEEQEGSIVCTLLEGKLIRKLNLTIDQMSIEQIEKTYGSKEASRISHHLQTALHGTPTQFEFSFANYELLIYLAPLYEEKEVLEVVGTILDITNRKKAEQIARKMAYYDPLTQLPNRRFLKRKIKDLIFEHETDDEKFALMFIDVDRFKNINDSMGHAAGDQILIQIAERLRSVIREKDFVARLGGDEFIMIIRQTSTKKIEQFAKKLSDLLNEPYQFRKIELFIQSSIGISMYPKDGDDFDTLIGAADIAMYEHKNNSNNKVQFFTKQLRQNILEKTLLEMDLRQAIDKNQLELYYQPKIHLRSRRITGVEALLRWNHPLKGKIMPNKFIPLAEETGMINDIGQWVIKEASRQLKEWLDLGLPPMSTAVNISISQFNHPLFITFVEQALKEANLPPSLLNLELTEGMMLDEEKSILTFQKLRSLGVSISVDDFGTGYSSLSYLSKFPITHLKIDQSFIQNMTYTNKAIIKTIVSLARSLNVRVIAEGVETTAQEQFLQQLNCNEGQGYLYSKPLPANKFIQYIKKINV